MSKNYRQARTLRAIQSSTSMEHEYPSDALVRFRSTQSAAYAQGHGAFGRSRPTYRLGFLSLFIL